MFLKQTYDRFKEHIPPSPKYDKFGTDGLVNFEFETGINPNKVLLGL